MSKHGVFQGAFRLSPHVKVPGLNASPARHRDRRRQHLNAEVGRISVRSSLQWHQRGQDLRLMGSATEGMNGGAFSVF